MRNYFLLCFSLLLLSAANLSFGQKKTKEFELLEYGFPGMNDTYYQARREVSKEWKITYKWVANCMVGDQLMDSVTQHNDNVRKQLAKTYGKDWEARYKDEVNRKALELATEAEETFRQEQIHLYQTQFNTAPSAAVMLTEQMVLYRGYSNQVRMAVNNNNGLPIYAEGDNCSIKKLDSTNLYVVRPGSKKTGAVRLYLIDQDSLIPVDSVAFRVSNLPDPQLYMGRTPSHSLATPFSAELSVRFPPGFPLDWHFQIANWSAYVVGEENVTMEGNGTDISPIAKLLEGKSNPTLIISTTVGTPDGIMRRMVGSWIIAQ